MKQEKNSVAKKIKQAMFDADLTQQELADIIKTDRGLISSWQLGKRVPTIKSLEKIAKATGKSLNFFVNNEEKIKENDVDIAAENKRLKKELQMREEMIELLKDKINSLEEQLKKSKKK